MTWTLTRFQIHQIMMAVYPLTQAEKEEQKEVHRLFHGLTDPSVIVLAIEAREDRYHGAILTSREARYTEEGVRHYQKWCFLKRALSQLRQANLHADRYAAHQAALDAAKNENPDPAA